MALAVGTQRNSPSHGVQEGFAAVCIGVAGRIVCMGPDENGYIVLFVDAHGQTGHCRKHEPVPEGHIGGYLPFPIFRNLLFVAFVDDLFRGMVQQGTVGILEDPGQVQFVMRQAVVVRHLPGAFQFLPVFLAVKNGYGGYVFFAEFFHCHRDAGGGIHPAAGQHQCLLIHGQRPPFSAGPCLCIPADNTRQRAGC